MNVKNVSQILCVLQIKNVNVSNLDFIWIQLSIFAGNASKIIVKLVQHPGLVRFAKIITL